MSKSCIHGRLARSCEVCEMQRDLAAEREKVKRLRDVLKQMMTLAEVCQDRYWGMTRDGRWLEAKRVMEKTK